MIYLNYLVWLEVLSITISSIQYRTNMRVKGKRYRKYTATIKVAMATAEY